MARSTRTACLLRISASYRVALFLRNCPELFQLLVVLLISLARRALSFSVMASFGETLHAAYSRRSAPLRVLESPVGLIAHLDARLERDLLPLQLLNPLLGGGELACWPDASALESARADSFIAIELIFQLVHHREHVVVLVEKGVGSVRGALRSTALSISRRVGRLPAAIPTVVAPLRGSVIAGPLVGFAVDGFGVVCVVLLGVVIKASSLARGRWRPAATRRNPFLKSHDRSRTVTHGVHAAATTRGHAVGYSNT